MVYVNNVAANSLYGMSIGSMQYDTHGSLDTRVLDNILINNEAFGMDLEYAAGDPATLTVDHNLYFNNGWRAYDQGGFWHAGAMVVRTGDPNSPSWDPYTTLAEAQAATPWEANGLEGNPLLWDYTLADHDLHDGSWPDFHLTAASALAIDHGVSTLPASLTALLAKFNVDDHSWGAALDIGRYEAGFRLLASPAVLRIEPGGAVQYRLDLYPADVPFTVQLTLTNPSPHLTATLSAQQLAPGEPVMLSVAHDGSPGTHVFTLTIAGAGSGFTGSAQVDLLVGGEVLYLPVIYRP
jgi:hypothetical protein